MNIKQRLIAAGLILIGIIALGVILLNGNTIAVLNPAGPIAAREKNLIVTACIMMVVIVVPVFGFLFAFAWNYRASNKKAIYRPDWDGNRLYETIWWLVPSVLIIFLAVITWRGTHELDPFKPIASNAKPLTVQVVALDWKWLFIYPQQRVASVNYLAIPEKTPINFEITSDAPMNSFWIPQLGGQIYAMPGMATQLHLLADKPGVYRGSSANISGKGFAAMHFPTVAMTASNFQHWQRISQAANKSLDATAYAQLAKPATSDGITYRLAQDGLFDSIVNKYATGEAEL